MSLRYIEGKKWEQVAREINYCCDHAWRIHGDVLRKIYNK